jgi:tetratricopeptide (TPR) repeat protein
VTMSPPSANTEPLLAEVPNFAEVGMNPGLVYQLQDRFSEAMAEFRRALKIKPTLTGANFFLGVDYCKNGDGAKAIPYLRSASRQEPNQPDIWSWLATAQEISGDYQAEIATLKQALSLQPRDVDMLYLLGHTYETLGKREVTRLEKAAPVSSCPSNCWPRVIRPQRNGLSRLFDSRMH